MDSVQAVVPAFFLCVVLVAGGATIVVPDSPYATNVIVEQRPFAPEIPGQLTASSAGDYAATYEEIRLQNDLLAARHSMLDAGDRIRATCDVRDVADRETEFRVDLQCEGDIDDVYRLLEPGPFTYRVTYLVDEDGIRQVAIKGYPYDERDRLPVGEPR